MRRLGINSSRAAARLGISLWSVTLKPQTLARYQAAVRLLVLFLSSRHLSLRLTVDSPTGLRGEVCLWEPWVMPFPIFNTCGHNAVGNFTILGGCSARGEKLSRQVAQPPFPASHASAFLAWCIFSSKLELGVLFGLGFHCLLRAGELLCL